MGFQRIKDDCEFSGGTLYTHKESSNVRVDSRCESCTDASPNYVGHVAKATEKSAREKFHRSGTGREHNARKGLREPRNRNPENVRKGM